MAHAATFASAMLSSLEAEAPGYSARPGATAAAIDLSHGELPVPVPTDLLSAGLRDPQPGLRYQDPRGLEGLRATYLGEAGQDHLGIDRVLVTAGAKQALWLAFLLAVRPRGVVLVPKPGWAPYRIWSRALCGRTVTYDPLLPDVVDRICARMRTGVDVLVLNSPHNPTGAELDGPAMDRIVDSAARSGTTLISDEVYRHFARTPASLLAYVDRTDVEVIVADSVSKWTAAAGLRVGFLTGRFERVSEALSLRGTIDSCPPGLTQQVASALIGDAGAEFRAGLRDLAGQAVDALNAFLQRLGVHVISSGGIYVWAKSGDGRPRLDLPGGLTMAGAAGGLFGSPGLVRLCPITQNPAVRRLLEPGGK